MDEVDPELTTFFPEARTFLCELRENNAREWFNARKERYEAVIRRPSEAFCQRLLPELEAITGQTMRARSFRIHRDVRFSKDKTPYHTHLHLGFYPADADEEHACGGGFFFGIETDRLVLGAGTLAFREAVLTTYRTLAADPEEGARLAGLLSYLTREGFRLGEIELKRTPPPFSQDHPHAELLRRKSLTALRDLTPEEVDDAGDLVTLSLAQARALLPLYRWLGGLRNGPA